MSITSTQKKLVGGGIALVVVLVMAISAYATINGARNGAITREQAIAAQYKDNQNELAAYVLSFNESLGIADRQSDVLNSIILEAVQGRYDGEMSPGTGGSMFSAIAEAYPDLTATTETYSKVQDLVVSGRDAFKNKQSKLLDLIRDYTTWTKGDIFRSWLLTNIVGAPTDELVIVDNGETYRGQAALDRAARIITTEQVTEIYEEGTQEPLITPKETE